MGPDLRSILFETQHTFLLKSGSFAWDDLNFEDIEILIFLAHLAHSAKVSFWDSAVSVVCRRLSSVVHHQQFT